MILQKVIHLKEQKVYPPNQPRKCLKNKSSIGKCNLKKSLSFYRLKVLSNPMELKNDLRTNFQKHICSI